jgi:hypothetical protein
VPIIVADTLKHLKPIVDGPICIVVGGVKTVGLKISSFPPTTQVISIVNGALAPRGSDVGKSGSPDSLRRKSANWSLSDLAYDKTVSVVFHKRDRYRRILGQVLVNGADAGLDQIETGMAWHYKRYEREQSPEDRVAYARAEETARAERRGLWRDPKPVPPWEFRRH